MGSPWHVRSAAASDVERLLELAADRREQYRQYEPQFWRPAEDARERQREFFHALVTDDAVAVLVATDSHTDIQGFAMARVVPAPPVYDPGGRTCLVDDFTVADDADWSQLGSLLIESLAAWASSRGASQIVVVTAARDEAKRRVLGEAQLSLASEWWVGRVPPTPGPVGFAP